MKVRIKFSKEGCMKFIGHLDMMRYFQKAIRRAGLPIAYSEGYSPHMIMSFAAPLGVGITSRGEYFDMELTEEVSSAVMETALNEAMVEGVQVLSAVRVEDGKASKAMSLVAAADYILEFCSGRGLPEDWEKSLESFLAQKEIVVHKKTKRSEKDVDIKPFIYDFKAEGGRVFLKLAAGSSNNTKPELVMDAFTAFLGIELPKFAFKIHRQEVYGYRQEEGGQVLVPLEMLGEPIE